MDTIVVVEGAKSFFMAMPASLLTDDRELAWAERTVRSNPALKWCLGKFVEADRANHNRQFWALDQLQMARPSITFSPLNLLHSQKAIGCFVDTEMMYPVDETAGEDSHPFIEALAVLWRANNPIEMQAIEGAHAMGALSFSMECVAESLTCAGEHGCGETYAYQGPKSLSYCQHLNAGQSIKQLNKPHFLGGALIIPPEKPGWSGAHVTDLSALIKEHQVEAEMAYEGFKVGAPDLTPAIWEYLMGSVLLQAEQAANRHKVGTHVHLTQQVGHFPPGTEGMIQSHHDGPFYGMTMGDSPVYYAPEPALEPNTTPPNEVGPGIYAQLETAAQASVVVQRQVDEVVENARKFSAEQRRKAADTHAAMPDGSFPIQNAGDLKNAIGLAGNAKNPAAARAHIKRRAAALGLTKMIPDSW